MTAPRKAQIGVTPSRGWTALLVKVVTRSRYAHAFLADGAGDEVIEGDPAGETRDRASHFRVVKWLDLDTDLTDAQRDQIVAWCVQHLGTPYSWIDDAEIGFVDLFHWAPKWMRRRLASNATLMCSQMCVAAYKAAGVDLFPGRPAGGVSPADLDRLNAKVLKAKTKVAPPRSAA